MRGSILILLKKNMCEIGNPMKRLTKRGEQMDGSFSIISASKQSIILPFFQN